MTSADSTPAASPEPLPDSLRELASAVVEVQQRMAKEWEPIVQEHIASGCTDVEAMHRTLDWVLDCACHPQGLALYRQLCRHLWAVDQQAAARAVLAYREMWDPDEERPWGAPAPPRSVGDAPHD